MSYILKKRDLILFLTKQRILMRLVFFFPIFHFRFALGVAVRFRSRKKGTYLSVSLLSEKQLLQTVKV